MHPGSRTWIEVSFAGVLLGKYELKTIDGLPLFPLAMTANGNVYAMILKPHLVRFAVLDRAKGVWQKLASDPDGALIGSEKDNLVFAELDGTSATVRFVPSSLVRPDNR